jgi:hypothetical protein
MNRRRTAMSAQTTPITERQLDLITRAHCDAGGLIEPLLTLKGGAKLKMIGSLASRHLIEQADGQWRLTPTAIAIIKGEAKPEDVLPPTATVRPAATEVTPVQTTLPPDDPEMEAAVTAAKATWQAVQETPRVRADSKQGQVIALLQRPQGTTIAEVMAVTGWQRHTVRGTFAGALKKRGILVTSEKVEGGERVYRATVPATAVA